jgi:hypothetical protein
MEPAFGMKFPDCLAYVPQDLLQFRRRKVGIGPHQVKQGLCEVGINNNAVLWVEINGHPKPTGTCKLVCEVSGQIEDRLRFLLKNDRLISTPERLLEI